MGGAATTGRAGDAATTGRAGAAAAARRAGAAAAAALAAVALLWCLPSRAGAQQVVSQGEALRLAFPEPAEIERRTAFLEEDQLRRARELAGSGVEVEEPLVTYYVGVRGDSVLGVSYFDAHRVRTLPEVLMVTVGPDDRVQRVELLKFDEPPEYRPPEGWLREFRGMPLAGDLSTGGDVVAITGATLTSRAVTRAVRRVLALHEVIAPVEGGP